MNAVLILLFICSTVFLKKLFKLIIQWRHSYNLAKLIPGPDTLPLLGNAHQISTKTTDQFGEWLFSESQKVLANGGNIIRLSLCNKYFFIPLDGKALKPILESDKEITKGEDYNFLIPWLGTGLLISSGSKWKSRRRMITPTFQFNMLNTYVTTFDKQAQVLVDLIDNEIGKEFDIFPYIKQCALDIICETAMGVTVNAQHNSNHEYVKCVQKMGWLTMQWSMNPLTWFPPFWYFSGMYHSFWNSINVLQGFTRKVIIERKEAFRYEETPSIGKKMVLLDMLIKENEVNRLSDEDIREEVDTFMFEGHDTTASAIGWALWCLACHPEAQQKVHQEMDLLFGGSDRSITPNDLKNMPCLERALKESNRMRPPVPLLQRELQDDFQLGDYLLPRKASIVLAPLLIHSNKRTWGNDCNLYNPDRFDSDEQPYSHTYDYIPFSAGLRNCIGQKFAMMEEKVVISRILRKYSLESERDFLENKPCLEVVLKPLIGVPIILKKRFHTS